MYSTCRSAVIVHACFYSRVYTHPPHSHTLTSSTPSQLHTRLEQSSPEVEELQKRVRILQGKLEREKSRTSEEIAQLASQKGAGGRRGEQTSEITPQVDDKVLLLCTQCL